MGEGHLFSDFKKLSRNFFQAWGSKDMTKADFFDFLNGAPFNYLVFNFSNNITFLNNYSLDFVTIYGGTRDDPLKISSPSFSNRKKEEVFAKYPANFRETIYSSYKST